MPSASSCFLLSFCFKKVVRESFSKSSENLRELLSRRNKDGARRGAAGGPTTPRRHPGVARVLAMPGSNLGDSVAFSSRLSPVNCLRCGNPRHPIIFSRKRPRPPLSPTLDQEGSETLPGTLPEGGNHHRRHLHHHACLWSDA